jgi:hypothetical protein
MKFNKGENNDIILYRDGRELSKMIRESLIWEENTEGKVFKCGYFTCPRGMFDKIRPSKCKLYIGKENEVILVAFDNDGLIKQRIELYEFSSAG